MDHADTESYTHIDAIVDLLGGSQLLGAKVSNRDQLLSMTRAGLPKRSLQHLFSVLDASPGRDTGTIAWLRTRLCRTNDCDEMLDPVTSEMTLRLATLLVALIGMFRDLDPAVGFLLRPHDSLDGQPPAEAIFTPDGVNFVEGLVTKRILGLPV